MLIFVAAFGHRSDFFKLRHPHQKILVPPLALNAGDVDPNVAQVLLRLSSKESFKIDQLRELFEDKGLKSYMTSIQIDKNI